MRVLFAVSSWSGHYYPMVPLAWALRVAGHEVRVLCAPSEVDRVTGAGLTPVPLLADTDLTRHARALNLLEERAGHWPYREPPPHPELDGPVEPGTFDLDAWWAGAVRAERERLLRGVDAAQGYALRWQPDLVVHDVVCYEGPLAAEAAGVPNVLHLWGPTGAEGTFGVLRGNGGAEQFTAAVAEQALVAAAGAEQADRILTRAGHVLDPCPDPVREHTTVRRLPIRYLPYNGSGAEPVLPPRSDRPRICVTWGRSGTRCFGPQTSKLPQVVAGAADLGAEVLLLAPRADVEACGTLPESVRPMVEVPLHLVLPDCDAVVHYGSGGSTMTSVVAGVPQLAIPFTPAGVFLADRFAAVGCARTLPNYETDAAGVRAALGGLVHEPSYARAARDLAADAAAMPAPAEVVGTLERIATAPELVARRAG
ncbi:nucleotide disphospho-sugar-binding domain-containing protein [Actinophytocola algeriensis]|uniref:UDP:flavonoid glycosyltransferase YjiC (YdhE family) n=1 Tax=Actinophytocola algeriensis TaxID=1768010 RepID=A0A7W7VIG7_9PSEU|nr:nucleotide disphospho-sugar-binding domain-containing protein [Actinophytocola algeriensis]MBB4911547.1 UDP:flavonoid glycosyltransferase YjiC (YdhE family) [Actinophytocola algeriensis]MBE1473465.1 UDP:flavonoid glycosyltransferase YjiC (YdhE family) [Actinophytocola algeriensis]